MPTNFNAYSSWQKEVLDDLIQVEPRQIDRKVSAEFERITGRPISPTTIGHRRRVLGVFAHKAKDDLVLTEAQIAACERRREIEYQRKRSSGIQPIDYRPAAVLRGKSHYET